MQGGIDVEEALAICDQAGLLPGPARAVWIAVVTETPAPTHADLAARFGVCRSAVTRALDRAERKIAESQSRPTRYLADTAYPAHPEEDERPYPVWLYDAIRNQQSSPDHAIDPGEGDRDRVSARYFSVETVYEALRGYYAQRRRRS